MARGLRYLTQRRLTPAQTQQIFNRFKDMDDRTCAIILGAMLDHSLERLLLLHMQPLSKTQREQLFSGTAPLSSFSSKIRLASALGIVGPDMTQDFQVLNEIRNAFAHSSHEVTFRNRSIRDRLRTLHMGPAITVLVKAFRGPATPYFRGARGLFLLASIGLVKLMDDARKDKAPRKLERIINDARAPN